MNGYFFFIIGFWVLALYCLAKGIATRRKTMRGGEDYEEGRRLAKAYFQRAALLVFIGALIFLTKVF